MAAQIVPFLPDLGRPIFEVESPKRAALPLTKHAEVSNLKRCSLCRAKARPPIQLVTEQSNNRPRNKLKGFLRRPYK